MSMIKMCTKCGLCAPIEATVCSACGTKLENLSLERERPVDSDVFEDQETRVAREAMDYREYARDRIFCGKCGYMLCKKGEKVPDCPHCGAMENKG